MARQRSRLGEHPTARKHRWHANALVGLPRGRQFGRACTALVWKDPEMGQCVVELLADTTTAEEMLKQGIVWTDMIYGKTVVDGRRHLR